MTNKTIFLHIVAIGIPRFYWLNGRSLRFPKVEGVVLAVIGRRLVSHLPLSKGYKRIHQCWYDENCTICLPITSKTTPLHFGDRQVEDFLPDSIIYSLNRVQSYNYWQRIRLYRVCRNIACCAISPGSCLRPKDLSGVCF